MPPCVVQVEKAGGNCSYLDQAMSSFHATGKSLELQPTTKEIEFLQIDVAMVATGVMRQAEVWKHDYGEALYNYSTILYHKLAARFTLLEENIGSDTSDIDSLKFVLNVVAEIKGIVQETELEIADITERYRTLKRYDIPVPKEEMDVCF